MIDKQAFTGVYSALFTAYDEAGRVNPEGIRQLLDFQLARGTRGAFVTGSSGEGFLLSVDERKLVAETALEVLRGRGIAIVHVGHTSTQVAVELAQHAEAAGADMIGSVPPIYYPVGNAGVLAHYQALCESVAVPVLIYNIPANTGVTLSDKLWLDLFAMDNLIGMKYTGSDFHYMRTIIELLEGKALVLSGSDQLFYPALTMGAEGCIGTTQNVAPEWFVSIYRAFLAGDHARASELQHAVCRLVRTWVDHGWLPACKALADLRGIPLGGARVPIPPVLPEELALVTDFAQGFFANPPSVA